MKTNASLSHNFFTHYKKEFPSPKNDSMKTTEFNCLFLN